MKDKLLAGVSHRCLEPLSIGLGLSLGLGLGSGGGGGGSAYSPSINFSDARNSQYFGVNFIGF